MLTLQKPSGELVLLPIQQADESYKLFLAYKFDVFASQPMSRAYIYVDAATGQILLSDAIIKHANGHNHNILKVTLIRKIVSDVKDSHLRKQSTNWQQVMLQPDIVEPNLLRHH
jgi:hypothetical protein